MGEMFVYKLETRGPLHLGERGIGLEETAEILHSDTLWAAIISAWHTLPQGEGLDPWGVPKGTSLFAGGPPVRLSSALPYAGDILFFPMPLVRLGQDKRLKKIRFISRGALDILQAGERHPHENELIQNGHVWVTVEERNKLVEPLTRALPEKERARLRERIKSDDPRAIRLLHIWNGSEVEPTPHVTIDRVHSRSNLHFTGQVSFAPDCGLAFWADYEDKAFVPLIEAALNYLQVQGLGGRRSTGRGQFRWEAHPMALPRVTDPNYYLSLSLCHLQPDELKQGVLTTARYGLILRGGWIYSPAGRNYRRRGVWMLTEGSLFDRAVQGEILDVRPEPDKYAAQAGAFPHPVWRSGLAFLLPLHLRTEEASA